MAARRLTTQRTLGAAALALLTTSSTLAHADVASLASAQPRPAATHDEGASFSLAALAGYRRGPESGPGEVVGSGFVYGLRAGYTPLSSRLHLGATFTTHRRGSDGVDRVDTAAGDFELGFDLLPGAFDLRPYLALGVLIATYESSSALMPHAAVGALAQYHLGITTLGLELRLEGASGSAPSLLGSAGVAF